SPPEASDNSYKEFFCETSGNQIFFDVPIGVSPPNSPKPPPRNESQGLPNPIGHNKQVDPGADSE
ncbi:hypothetical protein MKX03_002395, partial [Papaver bracteatum]